MNENKITAYKGFDKDFKCRGFQYEVGKDYKMDEDIKCCQRGFHACESPFEVFDYYDMLSSRFAVVELSGTIDKETKSTKICSSNIKIKAELNIADIVKLGIEWIKDITLSPKTDGDIGLNDNSGDYAQIGSSGDSDQIGSSGYSAKIGSSGDYAQIGSSGDYAKIGSSGYYAKINSTGEHSIIMSAGYNSIVKASLGSWITLAEWGINDDSNLIPICVKTEKVDGRRIKADTYYRLVNGEFKEVED